MNHLKRRRPVIDMLFLLALFGVFTICALFIVLFGTKIYQRIVTDMDSNYFSRTSLSYLTEKIRHYDENGGLELLSGKDLPPGIKLTQTVEEGAYCTYIYFSEDSLMEYTSNAKEPLSVSSGTKILPINDFSAKQIDDQLFYFQISDRNNNTTSFYVTMHSLQKGGSLNE